MWSSILGHKRQLEQIERTILSGRLPNAYLFAGPRGIGKRRIAEAIAATIACRGRTADAIAPCGSCAGCRKTAVAERDNRIKPCAVADSARSGQITKGVQTPHPDLFVVEPEAFGPALVVEDGNLALQTLGDETTGGKTKGRKPSEVVRIEQVRDLQDRLKFFPLEAPAKVAIVDEADRMTESTANAILKTLEEPPPATHFILISALPHRLLPTIRSRCRQVDFGPLPDATIEAALVQGRGLSAADAQRVAHIAGGSLGTALALDPAFLDEVLGRFEALVGRAAAADILETAEQWSHRGPAELALIFDLLAGWYRDLLRAQATGQATPDAARLVAACPPGRAERAIEAIAAARRALDSTANKQLMFEHLLFTLAA